MAHQEEGYVPGSSPSKLLFRCIIFLCDPSPPRPDLADLASIDASRPFATLIPSSLKNVLNDNVVEHIDIEEIVPGTESNDDGAVEILGAPEDIVNTDVEIVEAVSESERRIDSDAEASVELMDDRELMEALGLCFL